jgi:hypothetical protein
MTHCNLNMTAPQFHGSKYFTHNQSHPECDNVRNITQGWGRHKSNEWLCHSDLGIKIMDEERRYKGVRGLWDGLGDKCKIWRTTNTFEKESMGGK